MAKTRVEGLEALRAKVLDRFPEAAKEEMRKANEKNAQEFEAGVRRIIPKGDPKNGNLVDTLNTAAEGETGFRVTIGGPGAPYPLHLEAGHRNADGSHTPAKPFWNPTKRVLAKRARGRANRGMNKAVKAVSE